MGECDYCKSNIDVKMPFCPFCGQPTGFAPRQEEYEYEAFISYRHLPISSKVARRIQRDIEGFRIPKSLRNEKGKARLGRLFRDEDELPASTSLTKQIREALARSKFLIVVCTPETRASKWVAREIELFASLHGRERIVVALAEGERAECLPDVLLYKKTVGGDGSVVSEPTEPLAADFRRKSHKSRRDETLRIVAAMLGCGFDDLRQRERKRRLKTIVGATALAIAMVTTFVAISSHHREQLRQSQRELAISEARDVAQQADSLLASGNRDAAIASLLEELQAQKENDAPFVPELQSALERAVQAYPTGHEWLPLHCTHSEKRIKWIAASEIARTYATLDDDGSLCIYDLLGGGKLGDINLTELHPEVDDQSWASWMLIDCRDTYLAYAVYQSTLFCIDAKDGTVRWKYETPEGVAALAASDDNETICLTGYKDMGNMSSWRGTVHLVDLSTGTRNAYFDVPVKDMSNSRVAMSEGQDLICATFGNDLVIANPGGDVLVSSQIDQPLAYDVTWSDDMAMVIGVDELGLGFPCTIQAFAPSAGDKPVWTYSTSINPMVNNGRSFSPSAEFNGRYESPDGKAYEIAGLSNTLLLIAIGNGEITKVKEFESPICASELVKGRDGRWIRSCTVYEGISENAIDGRILGQERSSIRLSPSSQAVFATVEGRSFLIVAPFDDSFERHTACVYALPTSLDERFAPASDEAKAFNPGSSRVPTQDEQKTISQAIGISENETYEFAAVSQDGSRAVVQRHGIIYHIDLLDPHLQNATTEPYSRLTEGSFTHDGGLFYAKCLETDELGL